MSVSREPAGPESGTLSFDRAEWANEAPGGPCCRECGGLIRDEYFDLDGDVICPACAANRGRVRGRWARGLKAAVFGSLAAAVGAGVYRMFTVGTGWNFSLVAILVGYMVGGAVRTGSGDRGGRIYQFLAVFLTYSAIVGMFLPVFWQAIARGSREGREARKRVDAAKGDVAKAGPAPKAAAKSVELPSPTDAPAPGARVDAEANAVPIAPVAEGRPAEPPLPRSLLGLLGTMLVALLILVALAYSIPVVVGMNAPISALIFAVGLWQAWIMTRAREMPVTGPYRIRAPGKT